MIGSIEHGPASLLEGVVIDQLPTTQEDDRRTLIEIHNSEAIGFRNTKVIAIKKPEDGVETVIGGHWEDDTEMFYVVSGEIRWLLLEDPFTTEQVVYENLGAGSRIFLPPKVAHTLIFQDQAVFLAMTEGTFTEDKLIPYPASTQHLVEPSI